MISTFLALLNVASVAEQSAEKATIHPSLVVCEEMKYNTTMDKIGKIDDNTTARNLTVFLILPSE